MSREVRRALLAWAERLAGTSRTSADETALLSRLLSASAVAAVVEPNWELLQRPTLNPGATKGPLLLPDMLPATVWGSNLRGILSKTGWRRLSIETSTRAGDRCEICSDPVTSPEGASRRPDCHEVWRFEPQDGVPTQRLVRLIALCPGCHETQHAGRAKNMGRLDDVFERLIQLNGWTWRRCIEEMDRAWEKFDILSGSGYDLDLRALEGRISIPDRATLVIRASDRKLFVDTWASKLEVLRETGQRLAATVDRLMPPPLFDVDDKPSSSSRPGRE